MAPKQRLHVWQEHFTRWKQSGLSQRAYCAQQGLNLSTFHYWRKRVAAPVAGSKLIPLASLASRPVVVLSAVGVRLEVPSELLGEVLPLLWRSLREFD